MLEHSTLTANINVIVQLTRTLRPVARNNGCCIQQHRSNKDPKQLNANVTQQDGEE